MQQQKYKFISARPFFNPEYFHLVYNVPPEAVEEQWNSL